MRLSSEILHNFHKFVDSKEEIQLVNVYKGVPISYPAKAIEVKAHTLLLETDPFQIVCLYRDKMTFIQHQSFPVSIQASVVQVDFNTNQTSLSAFKYVGSTIGDRRQVRVEPKEMITGTLHSKDADVTVRGELADISLNGIAIYIKPSLYSPNIFRVGNKISVALQLPGVKKPGPEDYTDTGSLRMEPKPRYENLRSRNITGALDRTEYPSIYGASDSSTISGPEDFTFHGTIVHNKPENLYGRHRIGIQSNPGGQSRAILSQFIIQRQSEIIREVRSLYDVLSRLTK